MQKVIESLPSPIQKELSNVLNNLSNLITIPNNVLQGDIKKSRNKYWKISCKYNSWYFRYLLMLLKMGFPKYEKEDYGQTLAKWGVGPGCYLVLPVLGPSTIRDTAASFANVMGGDPWYNVSVHGNNEYFK